MAERGELTALTHMWETAVRQAEVIGPLAAQLRISRRQVYVLLGRWRAGESVVSDLLAAGVCPATSRRSSRRCCGSAT